MRLILLSEHVKKRRKVYVNGEWLDERTRESQ